MTDQPGLAASADDRVLAALERIAATLERIELQNYAASRQRAAIASAPPSIAVRKTPCPASTTPKAA